MDRIQRNINNRKQDKISLVNSQPSLRSMRDGEEALFLGRNGNLTRYRREKGILWKSEMSKGGNHIIDNKLTSQGLLLKFAGQKTKTALEILQNGFEKLSDSDQDQAQEFVIWLNAKAKNEGYIATQKEIDAIDTENQKTA